MATTAPNMSVSKFQAPAPDSGEVEDPTFGVDEKKLVAKLDMHLIPLLMLLYTFSFLDRYLLHTHHHVQVFNR